MDDSGTCKKIPRRSFLGRVLSLGLLAFIETIPKQVFALSSVRVRRARKIGYALWSWGYGSSGELGNGATAIRSSPVQIGALATWSGVAAGFDFALSMRGWAIQRTAVHP